MLERFAGMRPEDEVKKAVRVTTCQCRTAVEQLGRMLRNYCGDAA